MRGAMILGLGVCLALSLTALRAGPPAGDLDKVLRDLEDFGRANRRWNVPPDHGRFLWLMTETVQARRVLEVGTSNGYSSLWIARGLRSTGGKLITIEIDEGRAKEARANFARAGMDDLITIIRDDALKALPKLEGEFDLIFLDAHKPDYIKYFQMIFPRLRPGGVLLAHNAVAQAKGMQDFLDEIHRHPQLISNVVQMGSDGFAVSVKKKHPDKK